MFDAIRKLFSPKSEPIQTPGNAATRSIEDYFADEVVRSPYIKPEGRARALEHLQQKTDLTKTGNNLTLEEKRALGLNARQAISKELVAVLTPAGLALASPKAILSEMYYRAFMTKGRTDSVARGIKLGLTKFRLLASGGYGECEWCRDNSEREFGQDILDVMQQHCTCTPYCKAVINAVVEF